MTPQEELMKTADEAVQEILGLPDHFSNCTEREPCLVSEEDLKAAYDAVVSLLASRDKALFDDLLGRVPKKIIDPEGGWNAARDTLIERGEELGLLNE